MKILIVGLGSIAQKHLTALWELNEMIEVFALRSSQFAVSVDRINNIYSWDEVPEDIDFVMITNPTSFHIHTFRNALSLGKPIFLEKPPLMNLEGAAELIQQVAESGVSTYTAFNLRFHPVIKWAKNTIDVEKVREVNVYCGSYLPDWRPKSDYRNNYSSKAALGGGVHLDLIHEVDYIVYLFGLPDNSLNQFRKVSDLDIDSIDSASYWLNYPRFTASITLNYFRTVPKRVIEIVLSDRIFVLDLINFTVKDSAGKVGCFFEKDMVATYKEQIVYFIALIKGEVQTMNSFESSINTLKISLGNVKG